MFYAGLYHASYRGVDPTAVLAHDTTNQDIVAVSCICIGMHHVMLEVCYYEVYYFICRC